MIKINLLPPEKRIRNCLNSTIFSIIIFFIILLCVSVYIRGYTQIYTLKDQLERSNERYQLLSETVERKQVIEEKNISLENKNGVLIDLSKNRISEYAIMVHLSNLVIDNVWLTEVSLNSNNELILKGNAADYKALATFLKKIEQDRIFKNTSLINSESKQDPLSNKSITVFEILVKFKEG
jgi:Tfp pilus assembly protein PilN